MLPAIILFAITYVLMLVFSKYRPYIALASGVIFIVTGMLPLGNVLGELDFNVLLMIAGTMGLVALFIESKMPSLLADLVMEKVPNVQWAAVSLSVLEDNGIYVSATGTLTRSDVSQILYEASHLAARSAGAAVYR